MHDPMTVAHEIKRPWKQKPSQLWPTGYRPTIVTIWHVDPQRHEGTCCSKDDDSCGWFAPPHTKEQHAAIEKLGRSQYGTIFEKRRAASESYAYLSYEPSSYDAIHWAWRAIKREVTKRGTWQYGDRPLSAAELAQIYVLDSNPVDNLRFSVAQVKDEESCAAFFLLVYRAYRRFNRPWWKHPRWHVHHWSIQVPFVQHFQRWMWSRCATCGGRFTWGEAPIGHWGGTGPRWFRSEDGISHQSCFGASVLSPLKEYRANRDGVA